MARVDAKLRFSDGDELELQDAINLMWLIETAKRTLGMPLDWVESAKAFEKLVWDDVQPYMGDPAPINPMDSSGVLNFSQHLKDGIADYIRNQPVYQCGVCRNDTPTIFKHCGHCGTRKGRQNVTDL